MFSSLITITGLLVLEIVQSVDNAIVNAHMLKTMSEKARKWFLLWGILTAVFLVRGLLPLVIVWFATPDISLWQAAKATFSSDPIAGKAMAESAHILLVGGGVFLLLLYFHWLFMEKKDKFFWHDTWFDGKHGGWFYAVAAILMMGLAVLLPDKTTIVGALAGSTAFFVIDGFKKYAEQFEHQIESSGASDIAKLAFLEVLDLSFSIDGIFSAFAFTTNVGLILIGNGIGALVVRELTIKGVDRVGKYKWLKNGAMTSIGVLGAIMVGESFGLHIPEWMPTVITLAIVGITFWYSHVELKRGYKPDEEASGH